MGIPAFYRWLIDRYPRSVVDVLEDSPPVVNGVRMAVDITRPNPNGVEFDNLYLDMNGIIHPCFHPEDGSPPKSYDEVFAAVFKYIDRIFSLVRPRKLLFMAIDGVAPRAKMNQQRARRFRAAKDAADMASLVENQGSDHAQKISENKSLDSNLITPGTEFMETLSSALQYYVHLRINNDPGWKSVEVILSDATVPGEGEHKIMSYIRLQRNLPGFDPNTRHCLYGLDADLIMLALATHEVHFSVLREDVRREPPRGKGHYMKKTAGNGNLKPKKVPSEYLEDIISKQKFQFLHVWILRDYLAESLRIPDSTVKADIERLIDDFVFMCLFVGNDFLPHVPSLEISEGAIDLLMSVYKKEFVRMGGHLTDASEVNLKGVEHFVKTLGSHENAIFKKRRQEQMSWEHNGRHGRYSPANMTSSSKSDATVEVDKVNLGEEGWKERYYTEKFEAQSDDDRQRVKNHAVLKYVEGICWVMHYYYQGVCSWQWFYPYHYAPFASNFQGLEQLNIHFELGKPFKPFDQLMGVLPAASAEALPLFYRKLMTDPSSPIVDLYPTEFDLDLNGKKQAWKAICKLPFIDEARLLSEIAKVEDTLTDVERRRNTLGIDKLFVDMSHPLAAKIFTAKERNKDNPKLQTGKVKTKINPRYSGGMNGYMYISDKPVCPPEIPSPLHEMKTITVNKVLVVFYKFPDFHPHIPRPPEGVRLPPKIIGRHNLLPPPMLWHETTAFSQSRFCSRPIPPKSIGGLCLANIAHKLVSGLYSSGNEGNAGKRSHDDALNQNGHDDSLNQSGKKRKKRGGRKKRKLNDTSSVAAILGPIPPKSIEGSCLANIAHKLVAGIDSSGNEGNAGKRSHDDAMNQNGHDDSLNQNGLDDSLNQTGHDDSLNQNGLDASLNQNGHDDSLNQSGKKRKKRGGRKKRKLNDTSSVAAILGPIPPKSIEGSCLANIAHKLVAGIDSSGNEGNAGKRSHDDAMNQNGHDDSLNQNGHDDSLNQNGLDDSLNQNGHDDSLNQSGKKRKKRGGRKKRKLNDTSSVAAILGPIPPKSIEGSCLANITHKLVAGIDSSGNEGNAGKRSHDDALNQDGHDDSLNQSGKKRKKRGGRKKGKLNDTSSVAAILGHIPPKSIEGSCLANIAHKLVSGIDSSGNEGNAGKRSHDDALNQDGHDDSLNQNWP